MDDLIRREDAINALYEWCETPNYDDAIGVIRKVQSAQQWIPVSERMPEKEFNLYIVTYKMSAEDFRTGISDFCHGTWAVRPHGAVIAWMPLPKPWEESEVE